MANWIIELNDYDVRVAQHGAIVARSPGCAIVDGNDVLVGVDAYQQAQLQPLNFHNRFWYRLDQTALRKPSKTARHHADLAYRHIAHLNESAGGMESAVIVVSGGYSKDQLALLLGILQACDIGVVALVDAAVACAAGCAAPGDYRHVEIELHRAVVTEVRVDEDVTRGNVEIIDGVGADKLMQSVVSFIADQFLEQSRFDPLHNAASEQQLYNSIPAWLTQLHDETEIKVQIGHRQTNFEARITQQEFVAALKPPCRDIEQRLQGGAKILLGDRLSAIPGIASRLSQHHRISQLAVFDGCTSLMSASSQAENLSLMTRLPCCESPSVICDVGHDPAPSRSTVATRPSHILFGARATELTDRAIYLTTSGRLEYTPNDHSIARLSSDDQSTTLTAENQAQLRVNGLPLDIATSVFAGDEITIEGSTIVYLPIAVISSNAS